jgi:hypothetical protein
MGCDIHIIAEVREGGKWEANTKEVFSLDDFDKEYFKKDKGVKPFDWRSYSMFAFFAGVRNYDHCDPISEPRGIPDDASEEVKGMETFWSGDGHSHSWLSLKELLEFDYDKTFWNRRIYKNNNGAALAEEGEGRVLTYRENLSPMFFQHLEELSSLGNPEDVRIVFLFDN